MKVSRDSDEGTVTYSLAGVEIGKGLGLPPSSLSCLTPTTILADSLVPPRLLANTVVCWGLHSEPAGLAKDWSRMSIAILCQYG